MECSLPPAEVSASPNLEGLVVAVVGAGRIGAEVIRNLDRMGVGRIDVYESDARAAALLRDRHVVHLGNFWDELTLARLRHYDFAICTVDDPGARVRMNQKCLIANVNLMLVWTEGAGAVVAAYPFDALDDCACHECGTVREARPMSIAALRLTVADLPPQAADAASIATASIAAGLAAALIPRIAVGVGRYVSRRATLDSSTGQGTSLELPRDPQCVRCKGLQRPVPIVRTRNRWNVPAHVRTAFPEALEQGLELSDAIGDEPGHRYRMGELAERFRGGPIPAKFALTVVDGRVVCLDFEAPHPDETALQTRSGADPGRCTTN